VSSLHDKPKPATILAVDDDASTRVFLNELLSAGGYEVCAADHGSLVLASAKAAKPELILLDIRMPGMDGFEVCRQLKADAETERIPVIFLSASDELQERVQGLRSGAVDFVTKPVKPEELLARVATHVELGRLRDSLEKMVDERTAELRESESRFRLMADAAPVMIWAAGPDGRRTFFSKLWPEFTGRSEEELRDGWAASVHPDQREKCAAAFGSALEQRRVFETEYRLLRADGEYRWVLDRGVPRFSGEAFAGYVGSAIDITDFKQALDRMLSAQKIDSLGLMAAGVAHDFGNLLSTILSETDLALAEMSPRSPGRKSVERIEKLAGQAAGTVKMLMTSAGSIRDPNQWQELNISLVVEQVLEMAKYSFSKSTALRVNLCKDLAPFRGNLVEIRQVIMNLLLNSLEALGDKKGTIAISTERVHIGSGAAAGTPDGLPEGEWVRLIIEDTGCGIDPEICDKIFDQFFTTKSVGRGLGLSVALGIIRSHGGAIRASGEPGARATFEVLLPCVKSNA
jgi:PAS domain S-box-containing protein